MFFSQPHNSHSLPQHAPIATRALSGHPPAASPSSAGILIRDRRIRSLSVQIWRLESTSSLLTACRIPIAAHELYPATPSPLATPFAPGESAPSLSKSGDVDGSRD